MEQILRSYRETEISWAGTAPSVVVGSEAVVLLDDEVPPVVDWSPSLDPRTVDSLGSPGIACSLRLRNISLYAVNLFKRKIARDKAVTGGGYKEGDLYTEKRPS